MGNKSIFSIFAPRAFICYTGYLAKPSAHSIQIAKGNYICGSSGSHVVAPPKQDAAVLTGLTAALFQAPNPRSLFTLLIGGPLTTRSPKESRWRNYIEIFAYPDVCSLPRTGLDQHISAAGVAQLAWRTISDFATPPVLYDNSTGVGRRFFFTQKYFIQGDVFSGING